MTHQQHGLTLLTSRQGKVQQALATEVHGAIPVSRKPEPHAAGVSIGKARSGKALALALALALKTYLLPCLALLKLCHTFLHCTTLRAHLLFPLCSLPRSCTRPLFSSLTPIQSSPSTRNHILFWHQTQQHHSNTSPSSRQLVQHTT